MKWTNERPKKDGWYWVRKEMMSGLKKAKPLGISFIYRLKKDFKPMAGHSYKKGTLFFQHGLGELPLGPDLEFAGPIPEPEEEN
jgi:hypothetical protein